MQPMATGYTPEWGLGAYVSGQNAAMQEAANQEELIKQYLANQREVQSQPLDIDVKKYESDVAKAKSASPTYIPWMMRGYEGQMKSQDAAGESAQILSPFKNDAEKIKLQQEAETGNLLRTFQKLNSVVTSGGDVDPNTGEIVPASPQVLQALKMKRDQLGSLLGNDPKHMAEMEKLAQQHENAKELAKIRGDYQVEAVRNRPTSDRQPTTPEGMLARRILADESLSDEQKDDLLTQMVTMRAGMGKNASGSDMKIILKDGKYTLAPVEAVKPMTSPAAVKKTLNEKDQQALDWANENPNDPRAIAIKKRLGVQ